MSLGKKKDKQTMLFVPHTALRAGAGHPFYEALERILSKQKFDQYVEGLCAPFYAKKKGRPGLAPGVYFRCFLVGYFEGIDSERGIAWRVADSMSLRSFLGLRLDEQPPDHSTLSRTRPPLPLDVHQKVFQWVLARLTEEGLVRGKTLGVDATTLEANAALRSIIRRDNGQEYHEYLTELAKADSNESPTREDLAKLDKKRKKKGSNDTWVHPEEPDAEITKMKIGGTHLAHKLETAIDLDSGAVLGLTLSGGAEGDTQTLLGTVWQAQNNLDSVRDSADEHAVEKLAEQVQELVADKGYHSNASLSVLLDDDIRTYISEPKRGRRNWKSKQEERYAVYANRRRIKGDRGKRLLRCRGELVERPFAHLLDTGGMRRTHLRHHENILKRLVIHVAAFNLSLVMRKLFGVGKPRQLQSQSRALAALLALLRLLKASFETIQSQMTHPLGS